MNWERVKSLFLLAIERSPTERDAFLDSACGADLELRTEVESLIRSHERAGRFIERPAFQDAAELILSGEARNTIEKLRTGLGPVVGWLVCVAGPDRGSDYSIRGERNLIGRSKEMHICLAGDQRVSRHKHAVITYNAKKNAFKLAPGSSIGLVYLNEQEVSDPMAIESYDRIQLGETELVFLPLCGELFKW